MWLNYSDMNITTALFKVIFLHHLDVRHNLPIQVNENLGEVLICGFKNLIEIYRSNDSTQFFLNSMQLLVYITIINLPMIFVIQS